ncbi:hypothetical protein QQX98_011358 [Neonectria punicea]|uniref:Uncharacterized protein n=1 Tax=Neonectria punicea TaxID=979145 RepID=A0ABR1GMC0_9HYPO
MGLISTLNDMAKLTLDLPQPESKLLKAESLTELFTPQFEPDSAPAQLLAYGATRV